MCNIETITYQKVCITGAGSHFPESIVESQCCVFLKKKQNSRPWIICFNIKLLIVCIQNLNVGHMDKEKVQSVFH